jgi:hypothetical protein
VHDIAPGVAHERILAYTKDTIVNPAPLVLLCLNKWWLLYRTRLPETIECTHCFDSALDAVCAWLGFVEIERRGVLFLGKNVGTIIQEVLRNTTAPAVHVVTLPTTAVQ